MQFRTAALLVLMFVLPWAMHAQAIPNGSALGDIPRLETGLNYNYFHANAPPGQCGCFSMNGGSATVVFNLRPAWSVVADMMLAHASQVNGAVVTTPAMFLMDRCCWEARRRM